MLLLGAVSRPSAGDSPLTMSADEKKQPEEKKLPPWAAPSRAEDLASIAYPLHIQNSLTRSKARLFVTDWGGG